MTIRISILVHKVGVRRVKTITNIIETNDIGKSKLMLKDKLKSKGFAPVGCSANQMSKGRLIVTPFFIKED